MRRIVLSLFALCTVLLAAETFTQRQREFWSFQRVKTQTPPVVKHTKWVRTPVDSFIAAKLESKGIEPAPPADKIALLRRATFDLIGLPPTPEEVQAFLADDSPEPSRKSWTACSPRRTTANAGAATGSTSPATPKATASRPMKPAPTPGAIAITSFNRFNADKPYDRFVEEQIAGDEL